MKIQHGSIGLPWLIDQGWRILKKMIGSNACLYDLWITCLKPDFPSLAHIFRS